jgi:hypothetical protein
MSDTKSTSKQVRKHIPNPTGKGGFQERPQDRASGHWDSKMTFSFQYRRFMEMSMNELNEYRSLPDMERTVVEELAYNTVMRGKVSLADIKEITDRTEGKAAQSIDMTSNGETLKTALVEFVNGQSSQD